MRRALSAFSFASLLTLAPACDSGDTVGADFRSLDINVQMTAANSEGGSDDGTIVWEIVEAEVYDGPALDDDLLLYLDDNHIYTAGNTETCQIDTHATHSSVLELTASSGGAVLLTVWGNYVFEGEVNVSQITTGNLTGLLFEFEGADIFDGEASEDVKVLSTNVNLEQQSAERRLLMAALIVGECGSPGLTGYSL